MKTLQTVSDGLRLLSIIVVIVFFAIFFVIPIMCLPELGDKIVRLPLWLISKLKRGDQLCRNTKTTDIKPNLA